MNSRDLGDLVPEGLPGRGEKILKWSMSMWYVQGLGTEPDQHRLEQKENTKNKNLKTKESNLRT